MTRIRGAIAPRLRKEAPVTRFARRFATATAVAALVPLALAGCAKDEAKPAGSASGGTSSGGSAAAVKLMTDGTLTVCTHPGFRPFEFGGSDGKTVGFDIDLADIVAKKQGVKTTVVDIPFDQMTSGAAFAAKKCDIAIAAITINDKRKQAVAFSEPYFESTQALLVKKGAAIKDLADLKGKKIGVQTDTTGKDYADGKAAAMGFQTVIFEDGAAVGNNVKTGKVDAGLNDNGVMNDFAKSNADTEVVKEYETGEQYGMAVAKDNAALLKLANDALTAAKGDGSYDTMYEKWMGKKPTKK